MSSSSIDLNRKPGESELSYIFRVGTMKADGLVDMTWDELAAVFNKNLREDTGVDYGESAYRKKFALMKKTCAEFGNGISTDENAQELIELRRELEKEKVKLRDERTAYNKLIREEARKESYIEQFVRAIRKAAKENALEYHWNDGEIYSNSNNDMIIMLTDIHAGLDIHNSWNTFSAEVLKERMNHYLDRIDEIQLRHKSQDAYVVCSELISGLIHPTIRIQNNQDLIEQFITVTDYICDFLSVLSGKFQNVHVYVAPGNHSRMNAKKEESLSHENFDNLFIPYVKARLRNYQNVHCYVNVIEQSIAFFAVRNINVAAVHGDKDSFEHVGDRMNKLLRARVDLVLTGHRHTNGYRTDGDVKIVQSGCLSGSDEYAIDHRLRNMPEQVVCIISEEEGLDCIYDIKFKK